MKILYFSASWCSQCKIVKPALISAVAYYGKEFIEVVADAPENKELIEKYEIMSLPVIIILDEEKILYRSSGLKNSEILINDFKEFLT